MSKVKFSIFISLLFFGFLGCKESENKIVGDLYFVLLDSSNYHVVSSERRRAFQETALQFQKQDSLNMQQQELLDAYTFLLQNDVLDKPKIFIKTPSGAIEEVYISLDDFKEISRYSLKRLIEKNLRIYIEMEVSQSENNLWIANKKISIQKLEGKTYYKQN